MAIQPTKISELTEEQRIASLVALRGYKAYVANIKQTDKTTIVVTVFENSLGDEVTWSRIGIGNFRGESLTDVFIIGKTVILNKVRRRFPDEGGWFALDTNNARVTILVSYAGDEGNAADELFGSQGYDFEIRVYL